MTNLVIPGRHQDDAARHRQLKDMAEPGCRPGLIQSVP